MVSNQERVMMARVRYMKIRFYFLSFLRSYMKNMDGSKSRLGQMLDKFQLKKQQQAEVVNLADESDPIVSR